MSIFLPEHEEFLDTLNERQRVFVIGNLLLYVFHGCHQADVRQSLQEKKIPFDFLGWRRHLHKNGLLLRDGKLFVYAKAARAPLDRGTLHLSDHDVERLEQGMRYRQLSLHLRALRGNPFSRVLTARQFDRFVGRVLCSDDLVTYTRKYVYKKMGFLLKSYGVDLEDLENTLKVSALYGLQRAYPIFEHAGHGIAIAKTVVKRSGVNLMQGFTTKKNNQLLHDESNDSYSKTTVSLDGMLDGTGQFLTSDGTFVHRSLLVVGLSGANTFEKLPWDTLHALKELCTSSRLKAKQRAFLKLMLGNHSTSFSEFLGDTNDAMMETMPYGSYMNKVCDFLSIPKEAAADFLSDLRPHLGGSTASHVSD